MILLRWVTESFAVDFQSLCKELHTVVEHVVAKVDVFVPDCCGAKYTVHFMVGISNRDSLVVVRLNDEERGWFCP